MSAAQGVADKIPDSVKQNFHSMRDNVKEAILSVPNKLFYLLSFSRE